MPSLNTDIKVEFSVYCGTCGTGLCNETDTDSNKMRIIVNACPNCINIKDDEIFKLGEEIKSLKKEIDGLEQEINQKNSEIELLEIELNK